MCVIVVYLGLPFVGCFCPTKYIGCVEGLICGVVRTVPVPVLWMRIRCFSVYITKFIDAYNVALCLLCIVFKGKSPFLPIKSLSSVI